MKRIFFLLCFFSFFFFYTPCFAASDPLAVPNNKFGIHVADVNDIRDVPALINSTGGDWGYVTVVMEDRDRNQGKWQELFNFMRRAHLIPILRIATHPEKNGWDIPNKNDAETWATFLNSLLWPTQNRYVMLFNEPNHKNEWGGTLSPEEYVDVASLYAKALKKASPDFFVLPAGLDAAASSDGQAMDIREYLTRMHEKNPEFFTLIDGWTSHSYPNPAFSGTSWNTGKGTIGSFVWELSFLQSLGVTKPYPVFITETGWVHQQGKSLQTNFLSPAAVGQRLQEAANGIWQDKRIVAITPFVFSYQDIPFDHFSFKKLGSGEFYPHYDAYQQIKKTKGEPVQFEAFKEKEPLIPDKLVINSTYTVTTVITNMGQGICDPENGYELIVTGLPKNASYISEPLPILAPKEEGSITIHIKTPLETGNYPIRVLIKHAGKEIPVEEHTLSLIPPPNMQINLTLGWKKDRHISDATVLVYDTKDTLIHKFTDNKSDTGTLTVYNLSDMIPGKPYRLVVLVPYYLPRQEIVTINEHTTAVTIKRLLPFDFNKDGKLTFFDLWALFITKPTDVLGRFF